VYHITIQKFFSVHVRGKRHAMTRQRRPSPLSLITASVGLVSLVEWIHTCIALEFSLFQTSF
jgi:hypothetical protein